MLLTLLSSWARAQDPNAALDPLSGGQEPPAVSPADPLAEGVDAVQAEVPSLEGGGASAEIGQGLQDLVPQLPKAQVDPPPVFQTSDLLFEDTSRLLQDAAALPGQEHFVEAGQRTFADLLALPLFSIGHVDFTPGRLGLTALTVMATFGISRLVRRTTKRAFNMRGITDVGRIGVTNRLIHYVILAVGLSLALESMGIQLSALFAAGAVFAVGLGFAMQNIVQNFVSGVILLVERSIKPHDVLEISGQMVRVQQMGIRATVVRTRDEEELVVPNALLVGDTVKNYTKADHNIRVRAQVGVAYSSDMVQVEEALLEAAFGLPGLNEAMAPRTLLLDFGDNAVNWELSVWTRDPWALRTTRSELNKRIWKVFQMWGIEIAFPQMDVHLDEQVIRALRGALDEPEAKG